MHPPFGAKQVAKIRARLVEGGSTFPGTDVPQVEFGHMTSPDQMLLPAMPGAGGREGQFAGAKALRAWYRRMVERAELFHFSAPLTRHAWDCEAHFGPVPTAGMFPTQWGLCVFASPIEVPVNDRDGKTTTPIAAMAWGPMAECGFDPVVADMRLGGDGIHRPRGHGYIDPAEADLWTHVRAFTLTASVEHAEIRAIANGPLIDEFDMTVNCGPGIEVGHDTHGDLYALARFLRFGMELATDTTHGTESRERAGFADRAKARDAGAPIAADGDIRVLGLRPRTAALVEEHRGAAATSEEGAYRREAKYTQVCWRVRDSIDPDTGEVRKKGRIYYRDPVLLERARNVPAVRSGTLPSGTVDGSA